MKSASITPTAEIPISVAKGQHWIVEVNHADPALLQDEVALADVLTAAAREAGATILQTHLHHFGANQGVTGVLLLAESHVSIHTWPELGYAAIDIFMCGQAQPAAAFALLESRLRPAKLTYQVLSRHPL